MTRISTSSRPAPRPARRRKGYSLIEVLMTSLIIQIIAGMVAVPVIGVPTSVGYGASFGGIAALLGMLNSCANGVSVVNIDNGFGAGCIASMINHL